MTDSDIARYGRKVINYLFDSAPRNVTPDSSPIYCLGVRYNFRASPAQENGNIVAREHPRRRSSNHDDPASFVNVSHPTPPDSTAHDSELTDEPEEITKSLLGSEQQRNQRTVGEDITVVVQDKDEESVIDVTEDEGGWPSAFLDDFESRIWMTYRSNFPPIPKSQDPKATSSMSLAVRLRSMANSEGFTSDTGWGCMIRSGQSLLANSLLQSQLGRDWRRSPNDARENQILALFADDPKAPFSIHKFVEHGAAACGTHPGEWFGPSATARCIQALANGNKVTNIAVYITSDGSDVYEDEVFRIARAKTGSFQPILVLISTRLGLDRVTPVYRDTLKAMLQMSQSIGIAGGRPSSSHYFVGTQGSTFFYLDPHHTRPCLPLHADPSLYTADEISSCHTRRLRRLDIDGMDPSMVIGFLIRDEIDWQRWRDAVETLSGKAIIHIHEKEDVHASVVTEREGAIDEVETFDTEDDEIS